MIVLMSVFALILAACGLGLTGLAIVMGAKGEIGVTVMFVPIGLLILYGAYLFAREATRARRWTKDPATAEEMRAKRKQRRTLIPSALFLIASAAVLPGPGTFKVVAAILAALGVFVGAAATVAPRRSRKSRSF